jgi:hypothetical protein
MITLSDGIGPHSCGGTYASLIEWNGNRKTIEKYLRLSGASWFIPLFEKGIRGEGFGEEDVLNEFRNHNGFEPLPCQSGVYPLEEFKNS